VLQVNGETGASPAFSGCYRSVDEDSMGRTISLAVLTHGWGRGG